jgi:hypothetical protein
MSALSIGSWVWGEQRNVCKVIDIQHSTKSGQVRLLVAHPQGQNVVIPLDKVHGFSATPPSWIVPAPPTTPQPGERVKLKNTKLEYTIVEIFDHFMGVQNGDRTYETWARLVTGGGKSAHWKIIQLEVIE